MVALSDIERMILDTVREFVEREVRPHVRELDHANRYPEAMIDQMKQLGIFGLAVPESMGSTAATATRPSSTSSVTSAMPPS
jgi:alkylation response protein AidB-like acyl-CoA dehydrogenase